MPAPISCPSCGASTIIIRGSCRVRNGRKYLLRCACGHTWHLFGIISRPLSIEDPT